MPHWRVGGEFVSSGRRGGCALVGRVGEKVLPWGRVQSGKVSGCICPAVHPVRSCPARGGVGVSLPLDNYTSATGASARPMLAALLRRRGLGVAVMLGVVAALGVVAVLPPSPGQPCWRRMSAHSWLPAWRA